MKIIEEAVLPLDYYYSSPEIRKILGTPNFMCGRMAGVMRALGDEIGDTAEDQQAAVIHLFLQAYMKWGDVWSIKLNEYIQKEIEKFYKSNKPSISEEELYQMSAAELQRYLGDSTNAILPDLRIRMIAYLENLKRII
jgi:hypothetical protein